MSAKKNTDIESAAAEQQKKPDSKTVDPPQVDRRLSLTQIELLQLIEDRFTHIEKKIDQMSTRIHSTPAPLPNTEIQREISEGIKKLNKLTEQWEQKAQATYEETLDRLKVLEEKLVRATAPIPAPKPSSKKAFLAQNKAFEQEEVKRAVQKVKQDALKAKSSEDKPSTKTEEALKEKDRPAESIVDRVRERHKDDSPIPKWSGGGGGLARYKALKYEAYRQANELRQNGINPDSKSAETLEYRQKLANYHDAKKMYKELAC